MIFDYCDTVLLSIQKLPESGNGESKSPRIIYKYNDIHTLQFRERENKTCMRSPSLSLRAINKKKFTLMGRRREKEQNKYKANTLRAPGFCIYDCPGDTKHTNHPCET